ncbi:MAG: hypothetical protein EA351_15385 [Gemmatimonadales bacterium]|nr:MAG: hypothetical protein EA351_15385 [Gemmatimonadales bacterium]
MVLVACGDLEPVPPAELDDGEPVATMRFSEGLPSLPGLAQQWMPDRSLEPIVEQWRDGWDRSGDRGAQIRAEAIRSAAPFLIAAMPDDELERSLTEVTRAMGAVEEALLETAESDAFTGSLASAAQDHRAATEALGRGDRDSALTHALLAADHLRATTPDAVARALLVQGDEALRRIEADDTYPEVTRRRGERLLVGARDALDRGETTLALRRAWYAVGLLHSASDDDNPGGMTTSPDARERDR